MKLSDKRDHQQSRYSSQKRPRKQFKFSSKPNQFNTTNLQATVDVNVETVSNSTVNPSAGTEPTTTPEYVPVRNGDIGAFEKHTKGTASKIMTKM